LIVIKVSEHSSMCFIFMISKSTLDHSVSISSIAIDGLIYHMDCYFVNLNLIYRQTIMINTL